MEEQLLFYDQLKVKLKEQQVFLGTYLQSSAQGWAGDRPLQHLPILQSPEDIPWSGQYIFIEYLHNLFKSGYDYTTIHNSSTGDIESYCLDSH